jgi:hypothetical protein
VRDEKGLDDIVDRVIRNTARIEINNGLCGRWTWDLVDDWKDKYELSPKDEKHIRKVINDYDYFDVKDKRMGWQWRISDYGIEPLQKICYKLLQTTDYTEKLLLVDQALNVVHQRSDLASWFVKGGEDTLNKLANN